MLKWDKYPVAIDQDKDGTLFIRRVEDNDNPDLVFETAKGKEQAQALFATLAGSGLNVACGSLFLGSEVLNERGTFPMPIPPAFTTKKERGGETIIRPYAYSAEQVANYKALSFVFVVYNHKPQLIAFLTPRQQRKNGKLVQARPALELKRIDPQSPEGKAIASANAPRRAGIQRRG